MAATKPETIGENVTAVRDGDKLVLTVDLSAAGRRSESGKSIVLASTRGNQRLEDGTTIGLNVYRRA